MSVLRDIFSRLAADWMRYPLHNTVQIVLFVLMILDLFAGNYDHMFKVFAIATLIRIEHNQREGYPK